MTSWENFDDTTDYKRSLSSKSEHNVSIDTIILSNSISDQMTRVQ